MSKTKLLINRFACATVSGNSKTNKDSTLSVLFQFIENKAKLLKNVSSYIVSVSYNFNPTGFNDTGVKVGKASFNINTNYKGNKSIKIYNIDTFHLSVNLDDNGFSGTRWLSNEQPNVSLGYQGTSLVLLPTDLNYQVDLSSYFASGNLKFFLWECRAHINQWNNSNLLLVFNNDYYYQYKSWKISNTNYGVQFVTKGKYYEGLVPNL